MDRALTDILKALKYEPEKEEGFILKENLTDSYAYREPRDDTPLPAVSERLSENLGAIKRLYRVPLNHDVTLREFSFSYNGGTRRAFIVFIDGISGNALINENILEPLMIKSRGLSSLDSELSDYILEALLTQNQVSVHTKIGDAVSGVNSGGCALFADGVGAAFLCDVKSWEHRGVGAPLSENVIRGPQEAFCETLRMNTALIRKTLTDRSLVMEMTSVGRRSRTPVVIAYLCDVVNPALLSHLKRRLQSIDADFCLDSGELEQLIEDSGRIPAPQLRATERPDRACQALCDGRIVLLVGGSPYALILPALFTDFLYSVEDRYVRAPYAALLRTVRIAAGFLSVFLSGIFISVVSFHEEFLPVETLLSIQQSSRGVAMPTFLQLLFLELLFEILHEAAIRMPRHIGAVIGITGALVIGNSLIGANIVSPVAIICTAMSVLSTFANPSYMQNIHLRILRYLFILAGALGGLPCLCFAAIMAAALLVSLKSFGVPYFSPAAPRTKMSFLSGFKRGRIEDDFVRTDAVSPEKKYKKRPKRNG
ncbi:MAG: spore germination protein [Clostridia bacterium]|nr:spore germination protein [Clostridia bacterium]